MSNKLTLIIDGNWLLMSRFFVDRDSFLKSTSDETKEYAQKQLVTRMSQSISLILRKFDGLIDNIVFVSDNKSWRKTLPKPESLKIDYKGNRGKDNNCDMSCVFDSLKILSDNLNKMGITTCNSFGAEGDDWCWYWSRKLNSKGVNVILWTIDEDIKQLIQIDNKTAAFTAWYNDKSGCIFHEDIVKNCSNNIDFFMMPELINTVYTNITKLQTVPLISTYLPNDIICKKVFIGDSGDNITPIFTINKNGKVFKATEKDYQKISPVIWKNMFDIINKTINDDLVDNISINDILEVIYNKLIIIKKCTIHQPHTSLEDFISHFYYNIQLVWLHESQIPEYVTEGMSVIEYKTPGIDTINNINMNYKHISSNTSNIETIFDNLDVSF